MQVRVFDKYGDVRLTLNVPVDADEYYIKTALHAHCLTAKSIFMSIFMGKPYAKVWI